MGEGRRPPVLKLLLFAGTGLVTLAVATALRIGPAAERRWAAVDHRVTEIHAELASQDPRPLRKDVEPLPGSAWEDYIEAHRLLLLDLDVEKAFPQYIFSHSPPDASKIEALLNRTPRILELLRRGARRAERPVFDRRLKPTAFQGDTDRMHRVVRACAVRLARSESGPDAVEGLLDLLQAANDLDRADPSMGPAAPEVYQDLARALASKVPTLSPQELGKVDEALTTLEQGMLTSDAQLACFRIRAATWLGDEEFLLGPGCVKTFPRPWHAYRFGFSVRLMKASAFEDLERIVRPASGLDSLSMPELKSRVQPLRAQMAATKNPALETCFPDISYTAFHIRRNLAQVRLLRAAVQALRTGEPPTLGDPLGTRIGMAITAARVRTWSVGDDHIDQGGDAELDLVLEVER